MEKFCEKKFIVSLTSYPARIKYVSQAIQSLLNQTKQADQIVLYLSADQFPGKEKGLPEDLLCFNNQEKTIIRWVKDDLKPHKKYYYAFQEYPSDIILTVDDDVIYPSNMLEEFWETHLQFPNAVVAGCTHLMTINKLGELNPYSQWIIRTMGFEEGPSMQLFAVGVGGILYDPGLFPRETYNLNAIRETCLETDDLWLKAMEIMAGVPVVRTPLPELVKYVPGSQDVSLYSKNVKMGKNDESIGKIRKWLIDYFQRDVFKEWINNKSYPMISDEEGLLIFLNGDKRREHIAIGQAFSSQSKQIITLEEQNQTQKKQIAELQKDILNIYNSKSYRLGNMLIRPCSRMLSVINSLRHRHK